MLDTRLQIGIWNERPRGSHWIDVDISRLVGFLIEGGAKSREIRFHICVPSGSAKPAREELRRLEAKEEMDWTVIELPIEPDIPLACRAEKLKNFLDIRSEVLWQAVFANEKVRVSGWIVTSADATGALLLDAPKAVWFHGDIPLDFPSIWNNDAASSEKPRLKNWTSRVQSLAAVSETLITHSRHVTEGSGVRTLGIPRSKIEIIPHAPPDLANLIPQMRNRLRDDGSLRAAANCLRNYTAARQWPYLSGFCFESVPYVLVAAQDGPATNIDRAIAAVRHLVRCAGVNVKLFTTASFDAPEANSQARRNVGREQLHFDVICVPGLSSDARAALYHCAALTIHTSFYEGMVGALSFYESVSLGTPCLMARGPHIAELIDEEPSLASFVFDPYDHKELARLIVVTMKSRAAALQVQQLAYDRLVKRGWKAVSEEYARVFRQPKFLRGVL